MIPDSDASDVDAAVQAASSASSSWARTPRERRSALLQRVAALIEERAELLAWAESKDNGKTLTTAKAVDIPRAAANFRFFATAILHVRPPLPLPLPPSSPLQTEEMAVMQDNGSVSWVHSAPLGVAGLISPWNLPLYLLTWKIAPALASGNTVLNPLSLNCSSLLSCNETNVNSLHSPLSVCRQAL